MLPTRLPADSCQSSARIRSFEILLVVDGKGEWNRRVTFDGGGAEHATCFDHLQVHARTASRAAPSCCAICADSFDSDTSSSDEGDCTEAMFGIA